MRALFVGLLVAATAVAASPANAAGVAQPVPSAFGVTAMNDADLDMVRGTAFPLTSSAVRTIAEDQSRGDFTFTATIARTAMDNWWNDVGAQLIANNIPVD